MSIIKSITSITSIMIPVIFHPVHILMGAGIALRISNWESPRRDSIILWIHQN